MPGESDRKQDHIRVVREENVESGGTGFSDVFLEREALPEINKRDIDTSVGLFNHRLNAPIFIDSMTGGHPETKKINQSLAYVAKIPELQWV